MRCALVVVLASAVVLVTACAAPEVSDSPSSTPTFDPAQGTPTDKVRWGGQFALSNDVTVGTPDNMGGQTRIIEGFGKGNCSFLDSGGELLSLMTGEEGVSLLEEVVYTAIAVTAYCPEYKSELDRLMEANEISLQPTSWTPADNQYGGPTSDDPG